MDVVVKIVQLILSLSILVILHEFGHFFFARLFKVRVEKFYLFFDPWFSIFKFKKGDTEYGMGWLPLGGYVKIAGMIDESMDKEQMAQPPKPYEFRSKPAWQRLLIMVGGVVMNFITAIVIFWLILFKWGDSYIPAENARYGLMFHPVAHEIGLQDGDHILAIDGKKIENISEIVEAVLIDDAADLLVLRGDSQLHIPVPMSFKTTILSNEVRQLVYFQLPTIVDSVMPASAASEAGLQKNDVIVAIDTVSTPYLQHFSPTLANYAGKSTDITVNRGGALIQLPVKIDNSGKLGFYLTGADKILGTEQINYTLAQAFPAGINRGVNTLTSYVKQFKLVFTKEGAKQLGGFGTIGNLFPGTWNWQSFWYMTAFLSIILAFMNILPIPALDGGHVIFLLYEIVTRRKPSEKFMEHAQVTGMLLLLGLLIFANGNDLIRWLGKF
jgi:regulator of sigma E protease